MSEPLPDELKCPRCGGESQYWQKADGPYTLTRMECRISGCGAVSPYFETRQEADTWWTKPFAADDRLKEAEAVVRLANRLLAQDFTERPTAREVAEEAQAYLAAHQQGGEGE